MQVVAVTGGTGIQQERRQLARRPRLLVATPGRLLDHIRSGALDCADMREVVLDEADQMLDMGFGDDLNAIVDELPAERHSHLVSATFPDQVRRLADAFQRDPVVLQGTRLGAANSDIAHVVHVVHSEERYAALINTLLMAQGERCLVFVRRRADAAEVAARLSDDGFSALPLSGDLAQAQRTRTLSAFRNGTIRTLVATDVAARGIDVADISVVIQGDLPGDAEVYTHRAGRTGRAGRSGKSVLLVMAGSERRVELLLRRAGVEAPWIPVPSPKKIRRALSKRLRAELHTSLQQAVGGEPEITSMDEAPRDAEDAPETRHVEYARTLLAEHEPVQVVAALLRRLEPQPICEPRELATPVRREARQRRDGPPVGRRPGRPPHRAPGRRQHRHSASGR